MIKRNSGNEGGRGQTSSLHKDESDPHGGTRCECCGNEYDKPLEIVTNGISHYFDSFECAIHVLAPKCAHCKCRIIGHGLEAGGEMFCCAHCASEAGVESLKDRA
jgi:hypothetical protein